MCDSDNPFDCFFSNSGPAWGASLDADDPDGWGPENINMDEPSDDTIYRIGVHYRDDNDFGPSLATVRVYVMGQIVFELADVELVEGEMWEVATVSWPEGEVAALEDDAGGPRIITGCAPLW